MMAIFRINKTKDYSTMGNFHFRNPKMSWKAKGILSQMLSLPDDWEYSEEGLASLSSDGLASLKSGLKELERFGHLVRVQERNEQGIFTDVRYDIFEKPITEPISPICGFPITDKPITDKPISENHMQLNTKELSTKESNTKSIRRFQKPTIDEVRAYVREIGGGVSAEEYIDYYEANGWKVGKSPMKDWKAAVRNWKRRDWRNKGQPEERDYQEDFHAKVNDPVRDMLEAMKNEQ